MKFAASERQKANVIGSFFVNKKLAFLLKRIIKNVCRFKFSYFLFLKKQIVLDDKYNVSACLPDNDLDFDSQNKTAWLTGWGI